MNALQVLRQRIQQEYDVVNGQMSARTLDFSFETMNLLQGFIAQLPDLRTESLAKLAEFGEPGALGDELRLQSIGWLDRTLESLTEEERIGLVEQALARLAHVRDPLLLSSAVKVAETLPDLRTEWQARIAPTAAWGEKVKALQ